MAQPRGDNLALSNLTRDEKETRIESLAGLLSDYESHENKDEENIVLIRFDLLDRISKLFYMLGDYDQALNVQNRTKELVTRFKLKWAIARSLHQSAMIHKERGDYDRALELYQQSLEILEKLGDISGVASSYGQMGLLNFQLERYEAAAEFFARAFLIFHQIGSPNVELAKRDLARVQEKIGEEKLKEIFERVIGLLG